MTQVVEAQVQESGQVVLVSWSDDQRRSAQLSPYRLSGNLAREFNEDPTHAARYRQAG